RLIIDMAHALELKVLAEGVETEEQLFFLCAQQCDEAQGYLFGKPVPVEEFEKLLKEDRCFKKCTTENSNYKTSYIKP
ncbi:MAG TPA: EAL domain-containing protein, partial [Candidatus Limnocylindrales bacterium]|nr:EAL domain-containing protein [Candidatus Limnocylindrales bacterium]